ncbi:MAG: bifunctional 4-hydroxy-2-oxoglutarate aldolase/2-dehydro-3-deoxy-phosphogluconate aldolase [Candidatus Omnitrophica bacterium]|nr:bifunctional 4-hydroxy-2-oxoglutarate aldolase/2-dehydro-3-deoxy-phosphogluconate aldolase [Candidatus Omnitrophota bacterium]
MKRFKEMPLMGILRGVKLPILERLTETIVLSGMNTVEITMNTPDAGSLIKKMSKLAGKRLNIGAGTVLTMADLETALHAGASFIVSPCCIPEIMRYCKQNNIPVFPGALTPQEIHSAWSQGAAMVKVFPASFFGPKYIRELLGPFNDMLLMAVGGVRLENITEYFTCGAQAVAVGSSVFDLKQIHAGDFQSIKDSLLTLIKKVKQVRSRF